MEITSNRPVMVFKKNNKYSIGVSKKNKDGSYENAYIKIEFNKGVELEDKTLIDIKKSWLSFYNWEYEDKKGTTFLVRCSDFEKVDNDLYDNLSINTESNIDEQFGISESDLPF